MSKGYRSAYRMTPARRAALKKAQIASAKKRKRNKRIKIAAGVAVGAMGIGGAAYAGYKYGPVAGDIAKDMRARTPKNVAGAMNKVHSAVQPFAKEARRIKAGLTKGFQHGAGPEAGQSAPKPRPKPTKRTVIPGTTAEEARRLQNAAEGIVYVPQVDRNGKPVLDKNGNQKMVKHKLGAADRQKYNDDGTVRERIMGIPSALVHGRRLSGRKYSSALDKHNQNVAAVGGQAQTEAQRRETFNHARAAGQVRGRYQNETQRDKAKASSAKRRRTRQKRVVAKELKFRNQVMDQFYKDYPDA